jgi:hypothetical protein
MLASMPTPRAYSLKQAEITTTFTRATWYRWEKLGYVRLLRVANKTLVPAEEIDRVMAGEAVPHACAGWRRGQPLRPHRPGRPRTVHAPTSCAKDRLPPDITVRLTARAKRTAQETVGHPEEVGRLNADPRAAESHAQPQSALPKKAEAAMTRRGLPDDDEENPTTPNWKDSIREPT